jgi:NADH:ubiquinone oxidoreductase subunit F (NADH-binding)
MRRVLDATPATFDSYRAAGGGEAIDAAGRVEPEALIQIVADAGLRGRGGAGFPTGRKWAAVADFASPTMPSTVVVNAAEGEPGSFKDRAILRANPYRVLEGALVAAVAVGADRVIVALKATFTTELAIVQRAIGEITAAGWADGIELTVGRGPSEYLFGEETALLEVLDGRAPFPRVAPPFRHGVDEIGDGVESAAGLELASEDGETTAPPTLVDNVETLANVPGIVVRGPEWFREVGTERSPGTIVCTVTGDTVRHGVVEVAMGTPLSRVIKLAGGGPGKNRTIKAVLSGVANPFLPGALLETPLTYEDMEAGGSGLGAAGFIVFDSTRDMVACAQGVSRFLAVESCGQCEPCKRDGLAVSDLLDDVCDSDAPPDAFEVLTDLVAGVSVGNRCFLATQHERVVGSLLRYFPEEVKAHIERRAHPVRPVRIAPIVDIVEEAAVLDHDQARKQPDWTFNDHDSGKWPADRIDQELHHHHPVSGPRAT